MRYQARAPLRIDFGGGWTDVPFFAEEQGGAVLAAAITHYVEGYIARPDFGGILRTLRGDRSYVHYELDLPSGAGLGASAAQTVLWVTLVKTTIANVSDRAEVAEIACRIREMLGILGGRQDEYASALGGINYLQFRKEVEADRLELPPTFRDALRIRLVLVYSGTSRLSGDLHERVWGKYREGDEGVRQALANLKRLAGDMRQALLKQDLEGFGDLLNENWSNQKALDPTITNRELDGIFDLATHNGALGGKACGAGGGGCLVFLAGAGETNRLRAAFRDKGLRIIDFDFDSHGVFLKKA